MRCAAQIGRAKIEFSRQRDSWGPDQSCRRCQNETRVPGTRFFQTQRASFARVNLDGRCESSIVATPLSSLENCTRLCLSPRNFDICFLQHVEVVLHCGHCVHQPAQRSLRVVRTENRRNARPHDAQIARAQRTIDASPH